MLRKTLITLKIGLTTAILFSSTGLAVEAGGWPMHRGNAARTGYTPEALTGLAPRWTYKTHAPRPAWPDEPRTPFDRAYALVSDGKTLYFGSSADCKVYALDAASGEERWNFFTDGPLRPRTVEGPPFRGQRRRPSLLPGS